MSHRYAAILAADVAHYSTLMEGDGEGTVQALKDCRSVFQRCVSDHHGREFGSVGDSLMAEFSSPVEALRAAHCIHTELRQNVARLADGDRLQVRIGLHAGDVISDDESLFGDVVNKAARVQQQAQPGSTALSQVVHEQVRKEPGFEFRSLGKHALKNIADPVQIYEVARTHRRMNWRRLRLALRPYRAAVSAVVGVVVAGVLIIAWLESRAPTGIGGIIEVPVQRTPMAIDSRSIAVLPLQNRSPRTEDAVFVDGMHADILAQLARIKGLDKVISKTSVERYRNTDKSANQIAGELGVTNILESYVQRAGDRVRVTVNLINGLTDVLLWTNAYELDLSAENLFAVQSDIARDIATAMNVQLSEEEDRRLTAPTKSLEAYGEFVLGHNEMARRNPETLYRAQAHFEKAVELDPEYALAYVGLADSIGMQVGYANLNRDDSIAPRQAAIDKALELDPLSGEAYASLAALKTGEEKEQNYLKAIELSPNYASAYHWYGMSYLGRNGRDEEALPFVRKALELDPMAPVLTRDLARLLRRLGRNEEALVVLRKGVERNPDFFAHYEAMAFDLTEMGRLGEALIWGRAAARLAPSSFVSRSNEIRRFLALGDDDSAERCIDSIEVAFPVKGFGYRILLYEFRSQSHEIRRILAEFETRELTVDLKIEVAAFYLVIGETDKVKEILETVDPSLYGEEDVTLKPSWYPNTMAAYTLYVDGRLDRANYLFDQMLEAMQSMHRTRGRNAYGAWDAAIHAIRGDKQQAISALREAVNQGWRKDWWWLLRSPLFDRVRNEPEWMAIVSELEADVARQRQWYEEHKDAPLF